MDPLPDEMWLETFEGALASRAPLQSTNDNEDIWTLLIIYSLCLLGFNSATSTERTPVFALSFVVGII